MTSVPVAVTTTTDQQRAAAPTWTSTSGRPPTTAVVVRTTLLILGALVVIAPLLWAILGSFKTPAELAQVPPAVLPQNPTFDNYTSGLKAFNFPQFLINSVLVTVGATVLTLAINSMAAYALAKYNFRGRNVLFVITLATIMIPLQVILLPVYQVAATLGLVNSLWGLI